MKPYKYEDKLESERLLTRKLTEQDIDTWADFFADEEAPRFLPNFGQTDPRERAKHLIEKQVERYAEQRFGLQVILNKDTKEFLGLCGLLVQDIEGTNRIEVGYHFFKHHWGKGFAPEAAKLFINYAFDNDLTDSIISVIDIENFKSQRVAEKNGLTIEKQIKYFVDDDVYIYSMSQKDWKLRNK